MEDFLLGNKPNWALIAAHKVFDRDIEDEIYEDILDFITSPRKRTSACLVHSQAGYGVTTLLMVIAGRLVDEKLGTVFMLDPSGKVLEGDIDYVCSVFTESPIIFIIDEAANHAGELSLAISRLTNVGKSAFFLLGSRLNEWRQIRTKPTVTEFALLPLSAREIKALLTFLQEQNALGNLQYLSEQMRFDVIRNKNRQDLLVAMREVTQNLAFDAILENEFLHIANPIARKLYLIVSGFYQEGVYVRETLLAELLGVESDRNA